MPTPGEVPWDIVEHTAAKHDIYQRYLERWFPILLTGKEKWYPSVTYAEGFAGPGVYKTGERGSPVIALQAFIDKVPPTKGASRFLFIDDDPRCVALLRKQLAPVIEKTTRTEETMPVEVVEGTCESELEKQLTVMDAWGKPIFAMLDSWGNAPIPYRLLQRLAGNVSSEVMITFLPQHFVRFVTKLGESADQVFGGDQRWRDVAKLPDGPAQRRHLLDCYRQALSRAGFQHLLGFELVPRTGQSLYLLFGTNHPLGVKKMKDTLWEVDKSFGVGFRDPRDDQEETLFELNEPQLAPLGRLLLPTITEAGSSGCRVNDLVNFTLFETVFRKEHIIPTISMLRDEGKVETDRPGRIVYGTFVRTPQH